MSTIRLSTVKPALVAASQIYFSDTFLMRDLNVFAKRRHEPNTVLGEAGRRMTQTPWAPRFESR